MTGNIRISVVFFIGWNDSSLRGSDDKALDLWENVHVVACPVPRTVDDNLR